MMLYILIIFHLLTLYNQRSKNDYSDIDKKELDLSFSPSSSNPKLFFDKGTICIKDSHLLRIPNTKYDDREKVLRSYGLNYSDIIEYLNKTDFDFVDNVPNFITSSAFQMRNLELRDYQQQAIQNWEQSFMRGCVILPTGAGKTAIGIKAIQKVNASALVVTPTIDLMEQWANNISKYLFTDNTNPKNILIGKLGGGEDVLQAITVTTYDSAYLRAPSIGNQFKLIIFDEVHHLPAPRYRSIAEQFIAPYRLGLTATIEREDELHKLIPYLIGEVVFRLGSQKLSDQKHLAKYIIDRIQVNLTPEEQMEYDTNYTKFLTNLRQLGFKVPSMYNLKRLIMMSNKNKIAREAMLARNKANEIALNSKAKIVELQKILQQNKHSKTIIFTQNNKMVYELSNRFLIPNITYKTAKEERQSVLDGFKSGTYSTVCDFTGLR